VTDLYIWLGKLGRSLSCISGRALRILSRLLAKSRWGDLLLGYQIIPYLLSIWVGYLGKSLDVLDHDTGYSNMRMLLGIG
jgi:hypothetical protein